MYIHSKENQSKVTPESALQFLKEGNDRFLQNTRADRDLLKLVNETSSGQYPFATILSCMDSRTSAELIFDLGLGDIFSIRIAGNVINEDILGSMEYGTKAVGTKIIMVLGHTKCGAIVGACDNVQLGNLTQLLDKVKPAIDQETTTQTERNGKNTEFVGNVIKNNVHLAMKQIEEQSPVISELVQEGKIKIVGGIYDVETGKVTFLED